MNERIDAPVVVTFGESGRGKSTDLIYTLAGIGMFIGMPGGLRVAQSVVGYDISAHIVTVSMMEDVPGCIQYAAEHGFKGVGVDDASLLMHNTMLQAQSQFGKYKNGVLAGYDFAMWTYLANVLQQMAYTARLCGIPVILNCHEQPGYSDSKSGETYLIGPDFAWKKLVKRTPHVADISKRVVNRPFDAPPWDTRADCDNNGPAYCKDRFEASPSTGGPLNTAENLRVGGWPLPRPAGLEWMEEVVEQLSQSVLAGKPEKAATADWLPFLQAKGIHPLHIRWALRDGVHRARFRAHRERSVLAGF